MGASWIHGLRGNPIATIAKEVQAHLVTIDYDSAITYHTNGRSLTPAQAEQLEDLAAQLWQAIAAAQGRDPDRSVQEVVDATLAPLFPDLERQQWINFLLNSHIEHQYAGSSAAQSVHWFDDGDEFGGDDALFRDGYQVITQHLARGVPLVLQQPARRVQWDDAQVTVHTDSASYTGDRLIVTLPLGVLQTGHVTFAPALPDAKQRAITALGMGVLNKCYLRFAELFWPAEFDWLQYIPAQHGQWAEWVSLARPTGLPILLGFNAADFGREIETWSDAAIVGSAMQTLRHIFGRHIPEPLDYQITRWGADLHAYGSYSFNALGSTPSMRDNLARPVGQRLFFAGEATERRYFGTVHGAYLSGLRAAQEVMAVNEAGISPHQRPSATSGASMKHRNWA